MLEERLNALTTADRQFVWGLRHVDDLIERDRGSERFYVLHDHLSVTAIVNTTAVVQERYGYDGFGPQRVLDASFGARAASLYDWETGFGAYRLDTESGLCQVRHRYLHTKLGRWVGRDPAGYPRRRPYAYQYVRNNPTGEIDPSGLTESCTYFCSRVATLCSVFLCLEIGRSANCVECLPPFIIWLSKPLHFWGVIKGPCVGILC